MTAVQPGLFECLVGPEGRATIVDRRTWPCPWPKGHASKIRGQR